MDAGGNLKESGLAHWFNPNTGATNSSGFTLLPSGIYDGSAFVGIHYGTFLWCSSEITPLNAVIRNIDNSHASTSKGAAAKSYALSLRCIQNSMLENFPPNAPSNPTPEDGANDQDINVDISWTCSDPENDPLTYDVYFGINNPPDLVSSNQSAATYDPSQLDYGTTYFWKIIAQDYTQMIESNIWSFSTIPNLPPAEPSNPSPEDGAEDQSINSQLSWSCTDPEMDPLTYDVYLGNIVDPPLFASGITSTTFNPGTLNSSATYYWKIIANDNHQNNTPSPVWSFETEFICGDQINYAGQDYNTIQIGTQCWFAENLNVGIMISAPTTQINNSTIEKYCYDNNITNCDTYGGLYRWDEMMEYSQISGSQGICPEEWHIPTDPEWCILENFVDDGTIDCNSTGWRGINAGSNLKETGTAHWYNPNYGTNSSGFTALPGGEYCSSTFSQLGISGIFWSSDKNVYDEQEAWERKLAYNKSQIWRDVKHRDCTSSLRCIKN